MERFINTRRTFCACLIAIGCAVLCGFMGSLGMGVLLSVLVLLFLLVLPLTFSIRKTVIVSLILSILLVTVNLCYYAFVYKPVLKYSNCEIEAYAVVLESNEESATVFVNDSFLGEPLNFKATLYFEEKVELVPSSGIAFKAILGSAEQKRFSDSGVHISGTVSEYLSTTSYNKRSPVYLYHVFRQKLYDIISFDNSELTAFVSGVLLGKTDDIDRVLLNKFRSIGLSHILSVSGLHLMFAVMFMDKLLVLFGISYKKRALISIFSAFSFALMSGFAVPCIRSFIMLFIYFCSLIIDEHHDGITSLLVSAFIILLFAPYNLCNISFILSVLATYGMIVLTPLVESLVPIKSDKTVFFLRPIVYSVRSSISISVAANVACIPVFLIVFKQFGVVSPLVNLILALPIQLVFYISFATVVLFLFPFAKDIFEPVLDLAYNFIVKFVSFCYNLKYTSVTDGNGFFYFVLIFLLILVFGIFLFNIHKSKISIYPFVAGFSVLCVIFFGINFFTTKDYAKLKFVDVGQGNSAFLAVDEGAVVVDSGGQYIQNLSDELRRSNVKRIELLAITHLNSDHVSFVESLLDTYEIRRIVYPDFGFDEEMKSLFDSAVSRGVEVTALSEDTEYDLPDGVKFECYVEKAYSSKINDNTSALYKLTYKNTSVCFTGDMGINQEYVYLDYGNLLDCDILSVPHHGSASSSYTKILDLYSPDYSVISVAENNMYNLPDERIVKRLSEYSTVLTTAQNGTVIFKINEKGYKLIS